MQSASAGSLAILLFLFFSAAFAAEPLELTSSDPALVPGFGGSVAVSNDVVAAGHRDDLSLERGGGVIVFDLCTSDTSVPVLEPTPLSRSGAGRNDHFGHDVAMDGNTLIASAPLASVNGLPEAGAVYVYERVDDGTWSEIARLKAADPTARARFGADIDIDGDRIIVGAPEAGREQGVAVGAAYLFERDATGWQQAEKFALSNLVQVTNFGAAVAVNGDDVAISRLGEDSVYVYRHSSDEWQQIALLQPEYIADDTDAGWKVALENGVLAIAAPGDNPPAAPEGWFAGVVHVFEWNGDEWTRAAGLSSASGEASAAFGASLAMQDGYIAASTRGEGNFAVFDRDAGGEWIEVAELPVGVTANPLGLAVSSNLLLTGYSYGTTAPDSVPTVYVHEMAQLLQGETGVDDDAFCAQFDNATDDPGDHTGDETGDETGDDNSGNDNAGGAGDDDTGAGDDDEDLETVTGGDEGDDEGASEEGDDASGNDEGDDNSGENDDDGAETGGGSDDTAEDTPPATDSGGGGAPSWLFVMLLSAGVCRLRRRLAE